MHDDLDWSFADRIGLGILRRDKEFPLRSLHDHQRQCRHSRLFATPSRLKQQFQSLELCVHPDRELVFSFLPVFTRLLRLDTDRDRRVDEWMQCRMISTFVYSAGQRLRVAEGVINAVGGAERYCEVNTLRFEGLSDSVGEVRVIPG